MIRPSAPPSIVVRLPLEGRPSITFEALSAEDEASLRVWLAWSSALTRLALDLERLHGYLRDEAEAA